MAFLYNGIKPISRKGEILLCQKIIDLLKKETK